MKLNQSLSFDVENDVDGLIEKEIIQVQGKIVQGKKESDDEFFIRQSEALEKINYEKIYLERNTKYIKDLTDKLNKESSLLIERFKKEKLKELETKYTEDIKNEQKKVEIDLANELQSKINKIKDEETSVCFALYFKPNDRKEVTKSMMEQIVQCKYICYDHRAETAKLKRQ